MTIYTVYWLRDNTHTNPHTEGYIGITSRDPSLRLEENLWTKKGRLESLPKMIVKTILLIILPFR